MKKKIVAFTVVIVMLAIAIVGGTMAYFTDEDEATNTFAMGSVAIVQHEQERNADGELQVFTQDKPVVPAVYEGSSIPYASSDKWPVAGDPAWKVVEDNVNVLDKFVTVENTGKSAAYVRTIVAFEVGEDAVNDPYMHLVCNGNNSETDWTYEWVAENGSEIVVEIEGTYYKLCVFTHQTPVEAGETTVPSIKQIYLDKSATNEDAEQYGATFDILVFSQAIQADGFETAEEALEEGFGVISSTNHPWN